MTMSSALKLGLALLGIVYIATMVFNWGGIEQDVQQRTHDALNAKGMDWVKVDTQDRGRDVLLSGIAPSAEARSTAVGLADDVWGVRSVDSEIQFMLGDPNTQHAAYLQLDKQGEKLRIAGALHDTVDQQALVEFISRRLDAEADASQLQLASNVGEAVWLDDLKGFLRDVDDDADIRITLRDKRLILDGLMQADDVDSLMDDARDHFEADWSIENRLALADAAQPELEAGDSLSQDLCQVHMNTLAHHQTINFAVGAAEVQGDSIGLIERIANIAKFCDDSRIRVEGHTDNTGDAQQNLLLSEQRAQAVLGLLVQSGVDKARLEAQGYGMHRPVESNNSDEGRAKNRRIEFRILSAD